MTSNVLNFCDYLKNKSKPAQEASLPTVQVSAYGGTPQPILTSHSVRLSEFDALIFEAYSLAHISLAEEACLNLEKAIQKISYTDLAD